MGRQVKYLCGICHNLVNSNHKAIQCDICNFWIHAKCNTISITEYQNLQVSADTWFCKKCIIDIFPFSCLENFELCNLIISRRPSDLYLLPSLDIVSKISGLSQLDDSDVDILISTRTKPQNLPNSINFKYYYPTDFENLMLTSDQPNFSLFHVNICSLDANFDNLQAALSMLAFPFHIIGISETRESALTGFKMNNNLANYHLYSQPTKQAAGGVAIYVNKSLSVDLRSDLSTTDSDFETIWIEINTYKGKNTLCCCVYRHPSSNPKTFREHFDSILYRISRETKTVFVMGDFNLNLLNYDNHVETNEFLIQ